MPRNPASLEAQRKILESLGFGFVEEPLALPEVAPPPPPTPQRRPVAPAAPARHPAPRPAAPRPAAAGALAGPGLPVEQRRAVLAELDKAVDGCTRCGLQFARKTALAGGGNPQAGLLVVGEMPSEQDDATGQPFVAELGVLLDNILKAMKLSRADIYLTYAAKCAPMGARAPLADEIAACRPFVVKQIETVRPRVVLCLGVSALEALLPEAAKGGIAKSRGKWLDYRGIPTMMTYSLAYMDRNKESKKVAWKDFQEVMARLGE